MQPTILLTTTSYQDTPGPHHDLLDTIGATIIRRRGPLSEDEMVAAIDGVDALLCGDDVISRTVLRRGSPRLKVVSKYGIGVDKIDVDGCSELGIPLSFCPGVNHTTVAEHFFLLLLAAMRKLPMHVAGVREKKWYRETGYELAGKVLGIVGLGRIGQEIAKRAVAFGMPIVGYGATHWPTNFAEEHKIARCGSLEELLSLSDVISLNTKLTDQSRNLVCQKTIELMKPGVVVVNCGRGELVNSREMAEALQSKRVGWYATDVLEQEPPPPDHPLLALNNCIITPHIASRTFESVERQAMMATENLILMLRGEPPHAQVNSVPIPPRLI